MKDRKLLELAAKAAGFNVEWFECTVKKGDGSAVFEGDYWNPLTNNGDALCLAVKLGIRIAPEANGGDVAAASVTRDFIGQVCVEEHGNDRYAATRRAIVRSAADIGKAML